MPNLDSPLGLRPVDNPSGTAMRIQQFTAASSGMYEGAIVELLDDGLVSAAVITATSDNRTLLGVALHRVPANAAGGETILVSVDPQQRYVVQSNDATLDDLTDYLGRNFTVVGNASGNDLTDQSIAELDGASGTSVNNSTDSSPLLCLGASDALDNVIISGDATETSNAKYIVKINPRNHLLANDVGTS